MSRQRETERKREIAIAPHLLSFGSPLVKYSVAANSETNADEGSQSAGINPAAASFSSS
jgi:hypothetical protein